jgi:tetrahydromethanopterin S-methyltransferase subunit C
MPMLVKSDCPVIAAVNQTRKYSLCGIKNPTVTFVIGCIIGLISALVAEEIIFIRDYDVQLAEPLLFFGLLIIIVATPFITFELSKVQQHAILTGALSVAWEYSMVDFVILFWSHE